MALQGFDSSYYLSAKLAALQASNSEWADKDADFLETVLNNVYGMTAEEHYQQYGYSEGLAPNAYFDADEYILAKATAMFDAGKYLSLDAAQEAFEAAWTGNVYEHYLQYGSAEGINPSNDFDESLYLEEKLDALQAADSDTYGSWTTTDLQEYFASIGMTALGHYISYGADEGLTVQEVPSSEQVDASTSSGTTGESFTLTTATDTLTGTDNNDTFIGDDTTTQLSDQVDGGDGTDTLKIYDGGTNPIVVPQIENFENLYFNSLGNSLDVSSTGATAVEFDKVSTGALTFTVAGDQVVTLTDLNADATTNIDVGATVTSNTLIVDGVDTDAGGDEDIDLLGAAVTSVSITADGDDSTFTLSNGGAALETVTVDGGADLDLSAAALAASVTTVDAGDATGAVSVEIATDVSGVTGTLTLTGGSGDDTFNTGAQLDDGSVNAAAAVTLDGGDGTDTLAVDGQLDSDLDLDTDIVNFEILQLEANVAYDLDGYDWVDTFAINADITAAKVIDNIADGVEVDVKVSLTSAVLTLDNAGGPGVQALTVSVGGAAAVNAATLAIDGVENITINSTGTATTTANSIGTMLNADALQSLTITGTNDFSVVDFADDVSSQIVATDFTGDLDLDIAAGNQTSGLLVTLGTGDNRLTVSAADQLTHDITFNTGTDVYEVEGVDGGTTTTIASLTTIASFDTGAEGDVIDLSAGTGTIVSDTELSDIQTAVDALAASSTLTQALTAAYAAWAPASDDVFHFEFDSNTYVVYEEGTVAAAFNTGADYIVELTGVTGFDADHNLSL